jgi:hypothetical protein
MLINQALDILFAQPVDDHAPLSSPNDGAIRRTERSRGYSRLSSRQIATSTKTV